MQAKGSEEVLIRLQWQRRMSIFACDDFAVISTKKASLGRDECGNDIWTWVNDLPSVPMGELGEPGVATSSYLNTETFLMAWDTLMNSGHIWKHDFVVKADPDCVFFPDRLRQHSMDEKGKKTFYLNCEYDGHGKIFGALEVFSVPALHVYETEVWTCKTKMHWHGWGEDLYMEQCMKLIGIEGTDDFDLVGDSRCKGAPCTDTGRVAYHPFKDPDKYEQCHNTSHDAAHPQPWTPPVWR